MKKLIGLTIVAVALVALAMSTGCMQKSGPHSGCDRFQQTRGHKAHVMRHRLANPNDWRYQHERHAEGIDY